MIKFFRKIRQQLLTENKFSKYMIYAIGEIILVVIGILIALGINNWNENRKKVVTKHLIYERILIDIEKEISFINITIQYSDNNLPFLKKLITDSLEFKAFAQYKVFNFFIDGLIYVPEDIGFEQLKTINIKDSLSVKIVTQYEKGLAAIKYFEDDFQQFCDQNTEHWRDNYKWFAGALEGEFNEDSKKYFMNDWHFKNRAAHLYDIVNKYRMMLKLHKKEMEEIKSEIENTLGNN